MVPQARSPEEKPYGLWPIRETLSRGVGDDSGSGAIRRKQADARCDSFEFR